MYPIHTSLCTSNQHHRLTTVIGHILESSREFIQQQHAAPTVDQTGDATTYPLNSANRFAPRGEDQVSVFSTPSCVCVACGGRIIGDIGHYSRAHQIYNSMNRRVNDAAEIVPTRQGRVGQRFWNSQMPEQRRILHTSLSPCRPRLTYPCGAALFSHDSNDNICYDVVIGGGTYSQSSVITDVRPNPGLITLGNILGNDYAHRLSNGKLFVVPCGTYTCPLQVITPLGVNINSQRPFTFVNSCLKLVTSESRTPFKTVGAC